MSTVSELFTRTPMGNYCLEYGTYVQFFLSRISDSTHSQSYLDQRLFLWWDCYLLCIYETHSVLLRSMILTNAYHLVSAITVAYQIASPP